MNDFGSTDTGETGGFLGNNQTEPATMYFALQMYEQEFHSSQFSRRYAFDVDPATQAFKNRRVFTYVDTGIADGINVDMNGNVYGATADGAHVSN